MRSRYIAASIVLFCFLGITVFAAGGTLGDPLITLSQLKAVFVNVFDKRINDKTGELFETSVKSYEQKESARLDAIGSGRVSEGLFNRIYQNVAAKIKADPSLLAGSRVRAVTLKLGDKITGYPGSGIILESGAGRVYGPGTAELINITASGTVKPGADARLNTYYMIAANNGSGIAITSAQATVKIFDGAVIVKAADSKYQSHADALYTLGLFKGSNLGYELERAPTRQESLIMLTRLLGEEGAALSFTGTSPFTDHIGWPEGRLYVNFAYNMGYTKGVSETQFSPLTNASMEMYLTYLLRALGYSEQAGDFAYGSTTFSFSISLGLLTQAQYDEITKGSFLRDHLVMLSYSALSCNVKSGGTLSDKLIADGVITQEKLLQAQSMIK